MERKRVLEGSVVTLVTIPRFLPVIMWPQIGEYANKNIRKLQPCEVRNGKYYDLRTGKTVEKSENMLEWRNLSGTVFRYGNKKNYAEECLLISRRFENGRLILFSIKSGEITPMMMPRKVFEKTKNDY